MEALLYTRVSKEDQVKFGMSLDAQLESLKQYCSENNLKIRNIYSDEGISGGSITKRKAFQNMIEEAKPGDIILFTKLDRFSRNLLDANIVVKELTKKDVSIKAINEDDIDTSTADGKFIFNLKLSLAQREREKVSERINDVFAYKIKQGEIVSGQIPYGYMKKNKHLVLDPVKSVWMREMFEHYLKYQSLVGTCKWWNEQHPDETIGYTAFKKSRISNPIYCGKHPSGLNDNFCDPIISVEQFDKVQELLSRNIKSIRTNHVFLFTGLMTCSHCGRRMAGFYRKWKDNKLNYYRCYNHTQNGICDNKHCISERKIEEFVLQDMIKKCNEIASASLKPENTDEVKLQNKKANTEAKISRLKDLYVDGLIDREKFDTKYKQLQDEIEAIKQEMKPKSNKLLELHDVDVKELYSKLTPENKRAFWRKYIERIYFDGHNFKVVY